IQVTPLRTRGDDVLRLAQFFPARLTARQQSRSKSFGDKALGRLQADRLPAIVRAQHNAVERTAHLSGSSQIAPRHLPQRICEQLTDPDMPISPVLEGPTTLPRTGDPEGMPSLETVQRHYIHQVLHATGGNKRRAAEILGITRRTLYRWLE